MTIKRMLCASDFSPASRPAIRLAQELARTLKAKLIRDAPGRVMTQRADVRSAKASWFESVRPGARAAVTLQQPLP
jgi:hypothetical protein